MSRSFALLTLAAFALSAPLNARTLLGADAADASPGYAGAPVELSPPKCTKESAEIAAAAEAAGAMPDTGTATAEAEVKACCWFYYLNRWWCMQC